MFLKRHIIAHLGVKKIDILRVDSVSVETDVGSMVRAVAISNEII